MTTTHTLIDRIYSTGYFTNHGPIANELESTLEQNFNIENAIIVSNESLAVVIALAGLTTGRSVAVSVDTPVHVLNCITWAGLEPTFIDNGSDSFLFSVEHFESVIDKQHVDLVILDSATEKKLAPSSYETFLISGLPTIVYRCSLLPNSDPLYSSIASVRICLIDTDGDSPSPNCAAILTSNNELARTYRNIRSSYGAREIVSVMATANGRVSEYQAGVALKFIQNLAQNFGS